MFSKIPSTFMHRKVVYIDINEIHRSYTAPKTINEKLKKDILKNGMLYPLQIQSNKYKNCLIGNQRLLILRSLGIEKVPVVFLSERIERNKKAMGTHTYVPMLVPKNAKHISGKERVKRKKIKK